MYIQAPVAASVGPATSAGPQSAGLPRYRWSNHSGALALRIVPPYWIRLSGYSSLAPAIPAARSPLAACCRHASQSRSGLTSEFKQDHVVLGVGGPQPPVGVDGKPAVGLAGDDVDAVDPRERRQVLRAAGVVGDDDSHAGGVVVRRDARARRGSLGARRGSWG